MLPCSVKAVHQEMNFQQKFINILTHSALDHWEGGLALDSPTPWGPVTVPALSLANFRLFLLRQVRFLDPAGGVGPKPEWTVGVLRPLIYSFGRRALRWVEHFQGSSAHSPQPWWEGLEEGLEVCFHLLPPPPSFWCLGSLVLRKRLCI